MNRFIPTDDERRGILRESIGYDRNDFLIVYVAELNRNKNHILLLNHLEKIRKLIPSIKILFVGPCEYPPVLNYIKEHAIAPYVSCVGYKTNVEDYYAASDVCVSMSMREGLPVNIIEGMATGLPVVASINRGHCSLIVQHRNGFLFDLRNSGRLVEYLSMLYLDKSLRDEIAKNNILDAKRYSVDIAVEKMSDIYREYMN